MSKLQEALEEVQNTHIKEVDEMNAQLERQRDRTEELTEAVSTLVSFILQNRLQFRYSYWIHKVCLVAETAPLCFRLRRCCVELLYVTLSLSLSQKLVIANKNR